MLGASGTWLLWYRNEAGRLPQQREPTHVQHERFNKDSAKLGGTSLEDMGNSPRLVLQTCLSGVFTFYSEPGRD